MKVFIPGADGYLGWPTCMLLSQQGHEVVACVLESRAQENFHGGGRVVSLQVQFRQGQPIFRRVVSRRRACPSSPGGTARICAEGSRIWALPSGFSFLMK